jgi:hypothetical protein
VPGNARATMKTRLLIHVIRGRIGVKTFMA